jgi:hypothetical protein
MRKKNHQKRNSNCGKAHKRQNSVKVEKSINRQEIDIILKIQNLINDEIIKNMSSNTTDINPPGTKLAKGLNCGPDDKESETFSGIDFGLSKFVSLSSDSDEISCSEDIVAESNHHYPESEVESINTEKPVAEQHLKQKLCKARRLDSNIVDVKENIVNIMNKPLLSLCNTAKESKPNV